MSIDTSSSSSCHSGQDDALRKIKQARLAVYTNNSLANLIRRKLKTISSGISAHEIFQHLIGIIAAAIKNHLTRPLNNIKEIASEKNNSIIQAEITGGLGDLIIATRFLCSLENSHDISFVVTSKYHKILNELSTRPRRLLFSSEKQICIPQPLCLARIKISNLISVDYLSPDAPHDLRTRFNIATNFASPFQKQAHAAPFLDGFLSDQFAQHGIRRHEVFFKQFDLPLPVTSQISISDQTAFLAHLGLSRFGYVTISDGWDADFGLLNNRRPTKALPPLFLNNLCTEIGKQFPSIPIVQIGSPRCGCDLPAVSMNLRGQTSIGQASLLLSGSILHIDTEGGLVHLANSVGTPAAVFFGPTNPDFFAYEDNLALLPANGCTNCFWTTNTWMSICPLRKEITCMQTHSLTESTHRIAAVIRNRLDLHHQR